MNLLLVFCRHHSDWQWRQTIVGKMKITKENGAMLASGIILGIQITSVSL